MKVLIPIKAKPRSAAPLLVLLLLPAHTGALLAQTPQQHAWDILRAGANEKSAGKRVVKKSGKATNGALTPPRKDEVLLP